MPAIIGEQERAAWFEEPKSVLKDALLPSIPSFIVVAIVKLLVITAVDYTTSTLTTVIKLVPMLTRFHP